MKEAVLGSTGGISCGNWPGGEAVLLLERHPVQSLYRLRISGDVLRAESPLTLAEIVTASREYALEYPDSGSYTRLTEEYVAWCLLKLCEIGMAAAVIEIESANVALH